jgi:hypothetical protein
VPHPDQHRVGDRRGGGRPGTRVEQRQLTEHLARAEHRQEVLPAVGGRTAQLDLARRHDVEPVAGIALGEEHVAAREPHLRHRRPQGRGGLVVERGEQRCVADLIVLRVVHPNVAVHRGLLTRCRRG